MKKLFLVCIAAFSLSSFALVGCGSGTSTKVIEVPVEEPAMTAAEEAEYAKAMEESMK